MPLNTIGGKDATKFEVEGRDSGADGKPRMLDYLPRFTRETCLRRNEAGEILLCVEAFVISENGFADTLKDAVRGQFASINVLYDLWGEPASFRGEVRDWKLFIDEDNTIRESFVLSI